MGLEGKVALVTGASRGIGKAIALYLAKLGADVIVNYNNGEKEANDVVNEIKGMGRQASIFQADVSNINEVEEMFKKIKDIYGTLDIMINNAGITKDALLIRLNEKDWEKVIDINLKGVFQCSKYASKIMIKNRSGKIVNIASVIGVSGNAGQSNYAAAKAGIIGFSKSIAKELAPRGIQVNVVAPGFIQTNMTEILSVQAKQSILSKIPLGRYGTPEDVAHLVGFLVSDESQYITGQVIHVDGGMII